jgi:hypothetical protein
MKKENLIKVFAGSESSAILLKSRLKEIGVESIVKNDSSDAFLGTAPQVVDLYISKSDLKKSNPVIQGLVKNIT